MERFYEKLSGLTPFITVEEESDAGIRLLPILRREVFRDNLVVYYAKIVTFAATY
jgi:hypothetical protein